MDWIQRTVYFLNSLVTEVYGTIFVLASDTKTVFACDT